MRIRGFEQGLWRVSFTHAAGLTRADAAKPWGAHDSGLREAAADPLNFARSDHAVKARERLEALTGLELGEFFETAFADSPDPQLSATNLERWLGATTSPRIYMEQLLVQRQEALSLVTLLGATQPLADSLIQNPELANVVLDDHELAREVVRDEIEASGRALVSAATSQSHALDRLRFLRQRWMLGITVNDLSGNWAPEKVWRALSDLADASIALVTQTLWTAFAKERGIVGPCPVMVVAFGKLGGHELNYSSDIDLAYVVPDTEDSFLEQHAGRFCEALGRALSDRMGRGMLYRVDLRLRPYGKAGPIANSMRSCEAYYRLYAEPWEIQALLRSRAVIGPPPLPQNWEALIDAHCFHPTLSEVALEQMLESRQRTEAAADASDLKRGKGGIRDVEFLVQILQLLHGYRHPEVRVKGTCEAIRALASARLLGTEDSEVLIAGYTLLRQVEHRCQLVGDTQTHSLPEAAASRDRLARSMRLPGWADLDSLLTLHRRKIQNLYESTLASSPPALDARDEVLHRLGALASSAAQWLDPLPNSDAFYASLSQNESSLARVRKILGEAPRLAGPLRKSVALTEALMSGEIEEDQGGERRLAALSLDCSLSLLAKTYTTAWTSLATRWAITADFDLGFQLSNLMDALLVHCAKRLYADFDIIALGSYGRHELGIDSDADLLLLVAEPALHEQAERQAQDLLSLISGLRRLGAPVEVDLRLRPEGKQGLLVRTYEGFLTYELEGMEMWERFALGQARGIVGSQECLDLVNKVAYAQPLTPERLKELLAMKHRIETERVSPRFIKRDIKLGHGGLSDLEWFVHIFEMRYPTATKAGTWIRMEDRIKALARANLINAVESEELLQARRHLLILRNKLALLGVEGSVLPENPDKLDLLARALGDADGNAFLRRHERIVDTVRTVFNDGMERLKA